LDLAGVGLEKFRFGLALKRLIWFGLQKGRFGLALKKADLVWP